MVVRMVSVAIVLLQSTLADTWETVRLPVEVFSASEYAACLNMFFRASAWIPSSEINPTYVCSSGTLANAIAAELASTSFQLAEASIAAQQLTYEESLDLLTLIQDLAGFSIHIGFRSHEDAMMQIYGIAERTRTSMLGQHEKWSLFADLPTGSTTVEKAIHETDSYFLHHGFRIQKMSYWNAPVGGAAWLALHARGAEVTADAGILAGCHTYDSTSLRDSDDLSSVNLCDCLVPGQPLATSWGLTDADIELFVRLKTILPKNPRVFVIGNAFGYSSVLLASLLKPGSVDVIDAEVEGPCNAVGSWLTRRIAKASGLDLHFFSGFSPGDVVEAMRFPMYDLAFIDGMHTNEQVPLDFAAIEPHLHNNSIVVMHDVGFHDLHAGVATLPRSWQRHIVHGQSFRNVVGTVLLHRSLPLDVLLSI